MVCYKCKCIAALLFTLVSCKSTHEAQTVYIHTTDTVTNVVSNRDSIYLRDSIHVKEWQKGDTIYIDRYKQRIEYIDRLQHDSIYIARVDTCYIEREKEVEKKPTLVQSIKSRIGGFFIFAAILIGGFVGIRWMLTKL